MVHLKMYLPAALVIGVSLVPSLAIIGAEGIVNPAEGDGTFKPVLSSEEKSKNKEDSFTLPDNQQRTPSEVLELFHQEFLKYDPKSAVQSFDKRDTELGKALRQWVIQGLGKKSSNPIHRISHDFQSIFESQKPPTNWVSTFGNSMAEEKILLMARDFFEQWMFMTAEMLAAHLEDDGGKGGKAKSEKDETPLSGFIRGLYGVHTEIHIKALAPFGTGKSMVLHDIKRYAHRDVTGNILSRPAIILVKMKDCLKQRGKGINAVHFTFTSVSENECQAFYPNYDKTNSEQEWSVEEMKNHHFPRGAQ